MKSIIYIFISLVMVSCSTVKKPDTLRYVVYVTNSAKVECALYNPYSIDYLNKHFYKVYSKKRDSLKSCQESSDYKKALKMVEELLKANQIGTVALVREKGKNPRCLIMSNYQNRKWLTLYRSKFECENSKKFKFHKEDNEKLLDNNDEDNEDEEASYEDELGRYAQIRSYLTEHPEQNHFKSFAQQRKIAVGMSEELLILSWGDPRKKTKSKNAEGEFTQYHYKDVVVTVQEGQVVSWE